MRAEMKNMTPQQMKKMMEQVRGMDPAVLSGMGMSPEMMRQFEQLTPEVRHVRAAPAPRLRPARLLTHRPQDMAAQQEAMKNMSADELAAATAAARSGMGGMGGQDAGRQQYYFGASQTLKNEGNKLVGCGARQSGGSARAPSHRLLPPAAPASLRRRPRSTAAPRTT